MKSKILADFQTFLKNDDNQTRINDSLLNYIIKHKTKVLNILRCMKSYFSKYNRRQITSYVLYLSREQEGADTRILSHSQYIVNIQEDAHILIR